MKINRRTLHKILVKYQKLMKSDERRKVYWINRLMMKDQARRFELPFEEDAKGEWTLKIDYPDDAENLSGLTDSVDIVACPFCGAPLN